MAFALSSGLGLACSSDGTADADKGASTAEPSAGKSAAAGSSGARAQSAGRGGAGGSGRVAEATAGRNSASQPVSGRPSAPASHDDDADAGMVTTIAPTIRKTPPDPNIMFDWQEAAPGRPQNCEPGHYVGTFMCDLKTQDLGTAHITGPVELTLSQAQNGEFLEISDAHISGYALLVLNFEATLAGRLECTTRKLEAMAVNGSVGLGSAALLPVLGFSGDLRGDLNEAGDALSGTWSFPVTLGDGSQLGTCVGPWTAMRTMP